jgi:hypothetical protein
MCLTIVLKGFPSCFTYIVAVVIVVCYEDLTRCTGQVRNSLSQSIDCEMRHDDDMTGRNSCAIAMSQSLSVESR